MGGVKSENSLAKLLATTQIGGMGPFGWRDLNVANKQEYQKRGDSICCAFTNIFRIMCVE